MKLQELITERKKNVKLKVATRSGGFGTRAVRSEQETEKEIEDILRKKFKLQRAIDFVFRKNSIQFQKAEDVTPEVLKALKKYT